MQAMTDFTVIPLNEELVSTLKDSQCQRALTQAVQCKFGCTAVIHGVDGDSGRSPTQPAAPEKRYSMQLPGGVTVSVWKDNLTTHRVDAVVNAANKQLQHGGGLARALCDAGGQEIQNESQRLIDRYGALFTGDAVVTKAGNLPCQKVIHAVGPDLPAYPTKQAVDQAVPLLEKAVRNILLRVEEEHLQSVAIPALSSGLFNFPLPLCATTIVKTLKNFSDRRPFTSQPLDIRLVNNDEKTVLEMTQACTHILASTGLYSQAVQSRGKGPVKAPPSSVTPPATRSSSSTVQIGSVSLTLKKGNIEKEMADVIVNTTAPGCDLMAGLISKAISQKAGHQMQAELKRGPPGRTGQVLVTKGYKLDCQMVYHTLCPHRNEPSATRTLQEVILTCLQKAADHGMQSISFPAIGTGNLNFQKKEVAEMMTWTASEFAKNFQRKMNINFVIYPTDNDTLEEFSRAFEVQRMILQTSPSSHSSSTEGFVQTNNHHKSRPEMPCIKLSGACEERILEAKQWIYEVLCPASENVIIQNNFIQHFGQLEHEELLSVQNKWRVSFVESFLDGSASIMITGALRDVAAVGLVVEAMCCKAQEEFAKDEESNLALMTNIKVSYQKKNVEPDRQRSHNFAGFDIVRVEKVDNPSLKEAFELKKQQLSAKPQQMFQRLPAQFCELVSRVGFQREVSPPKVQRYGAGIYFSGSVTGADQLWKDLPGEEYLYFVEAQVLTGRSIHGSPELIVPPATGSDPLILYDSVNGGRDIYVIFNGHQALPEYLITCKKAAS